jgi:very-short-patch-repair endonuclease
MGAQEPPSEPDPSSHLAHREKSVAKPMGEGGPPVARSTHPPIDEGLLAFARGLRGQQTDAEAYLWALLRNGRLAGWKFRRQHPVHPYILDFYCHRAKLAVELDGGQHHGEAGRAHDEERAQHLQSQGIHVLRFWNVKVFEEVESVLEVILKALEERGP